MAKEKFDRSKSHVNIGTIGHVDHGKTTLTLLLYYQNTVAGKHKATILSITLQKKKNVESQSTLLISNMKLKLVTMHTLTAQDTRTTLKHDHWCRSNGRSYLSSFCADGPMPQTREHILLSRNVGVPYIVVFLNKMDMVDDEELLELVEMEVRDLLSEYDFPGDDVPVIAGSALKALEGDESYEEKS